MFIEFPSVLDVREIEIEISLLSESLSRCSARVAASILDFTGYISGVYSSSLCLSAEINDSRPD